MKKEIFYTLLFFISLLHLHHEVIAQKTDTIVHINGNVLTGDFKKMKYGVVSWKMDGMGTISLEEVKINTIKSKKIFEIKMNNSFIYFGSFDTSSIARKVNIISHNQRELVDVQDIVEVYPIRRNFWMRTTGNFNLGGNYSKGSDIATIAFSGNLDYRKEKTYFNLVWDDNNTFQADTLSSTKADISLAWQRQIKNKYSSQVTIGASQNSELGIKQNYSLALAGLRDISYNVWNRLYTGVGLVGTRQIPLDDSGETTDLTGLIQVVWKVYRYSTPKISVDSNINFQPYLTSNGRYTTAINLSPSISIFSDDFKVGFKLYYNFDSQPATETASNSDYGINLQFTYSFH